MTTQPAAWKSVPEVGSLTGLRLLVGTLRLFGRRAAHGLLWAVCWYFVALAPSARRASRVALTRLGHRATLRDVHAHFFTFARVALDRLLFLSGRDEGLTVHLHGHEHVMELARSGRGGLLVGAHLGSFEALRALASRYDVPLLVLVDFRNARRLNDFLAQQAPGLRVRVLQLDPEAPVAVLAAREAVERGELVAILGDRATEARGAPPPPVSRSLAQRAHRDVTATFLGRPARFPSGPWVLAHVLECPVFFVCAHFEAPGTYHAHCVPLADRVRLPRLGRRAALDGHVQRYAAQLEAFALRAPLNWFNFFSFWEDT